LGAYVFAALATHGVGRPHLSMDQAPVPDHRAARSQTAPPL
jgi:hypothetical protein